MNFVVLISLTFHLNRRDTLIINLNITSTLGQRVETYSDPNKMSSDDVCTGNVEFESKLQKDKFVKELEQQKLQKDKFLKEFGQQIQKHNELLTEFEKMKNSRYLEPEDMIRFRALCRKCWQTMNTFNKTWSML